MSTTMKALSLSAILLTLLLSVVVGRVAVAAHMPDDRADAILKSMHDNGGKVTTLQASVVQTKRSTQIPGPPLTYSGMLYFKHEANKDKIRLTYSRGGQVTNDLLMDGDSIILYQPKIKQAIVTSRQKLARENPEYDFLLAPHASVSGLKSRYAISYQRDEAVGAFSTSVIQLLPVAESSFTRVIFWIDRSLWLPVQYRVDEINGDITTLTLSDIKTSDKVPPDAFKLVLPEGTKKIQQ